MPQKLIALLAALALMAQQSAHAQQDSPLLKQRRAELAWSELSAILTEKKISTRLPDGVKVEGEVLAVRPDGLVMDVHKTSSRKLHPKGQSEFPRESIRELRVVRDRGPMKAVGGVTGATGGLTATGFLAYATESTGLVLAGLVFLVPIAIVAGYYAGKAADRRTTLITVRQDAAEE